MERFMKGVAVTAPGKAQIVKDIPVPDPGEYGCLVRIKCCAYSSLTCDDVIAGRNCGLPVLPGRGGVGTVISTGKKVRYISRGERFLSPLVGDGGGYSSDRGNFAEYGVVFDEKAILEDGAELPAVPAGSCIPLGLPLSDSDAAMLPLISGVVSAVLSARPAAGESFAVNGGGSLGRAAADLLELLGIECRIIDDGLETAGNRSDAKEDIDADNRPDGVREALRGSCDAIIDLSGENDNKKEPGELLKPGGRVVSAFPGKRYPDGAEVIPVTGLPYGRECLEFVCKLAGEGLIWPSRYYSDIMPVDFIGECIRLGRESEASAIILML